MPTPLPVKSLYLVSGVAGSNTKLSDFERQQRSEWCWAAVSVSIGKLFYGTKAPYGTQCQLASAVYSTWGDHNKDCCQFLCPPDRFSARDYCNFGLPDVLIPMTLNKIIRGGRQCGAADDSAIRASLSAGCPVCVEIDYGGGQHFLAIVDVSGPANQPQYQVADPWVPSIRFLPREELLHSYQSVPGPFGRWINTYFTGKAAD
jgi:hypothetical protein